MVSVDEVAEAITVLIARYESLRTTYVAGEPPQQRIAAAGVQMLEVCSLARDNGDRTTVAQWPTRSSGGYARHPIRLGPWCA